VDPTAAPIDLELEGHTYKAYPFRDRDHAELTNWVRREYLARVSEATDDPRILDRATLFAACLYWTSSDGRELTTTLEGMHKMACILCRELIPKEIVRSSENVRKIIDAFLYLHRVERKDATAQKEEGSSGN